MALPTVFTIGDVFTAANANLLRSNQYNLTTSTKTVSYVLVAADVGTRVLMNAAGSTTITVNTSLFSAGDTLEISNIGAGVCTVTSGTCTVTSSSSLALAQYQSGTLFFTSASAAIFIASAVTATAGGLVSIAPTSVAVGSGTGTASANGQVTFAGASSVSLNGVFTSSYQNYRLVFNASAVAGNSVQCRFRIAGTDTTAANYNHQILVASNTTVAGARVTSDTSILFMNNINTVHDSASAEIYSPQATKFTTINVPSTSTVSTIYYQTTAGSYALTTSFDGITLFSASNLTGTVTVYGYNQ